MCTDKNIKELLPAYVEGTLEQPEKLRIEGHLGSCKDCRAETALLRLMVGEIVPDPGETFWATMPDRVYRAVQEQRSARKTFDLDRLRDWLTLPRWAWAAAAIGMVLVISWAILLPVKTGQEPFLSEDDEFADEVMVADSMGALNLAELGNDELASVDGWAGKELASIALEAEPVINNHDSDISEELAELNLQEIERLSKMIDQLKEEG